MDWIKLRTFRSLKPKPSLVTKSIESLVWKDDTIKNTINVSVLFLLNPNSALNNYLENFTVRRGLRPKPNFSQLVTNSLDPKFTEIYYFSFLLRGLMSQLIHSQNPLQSACHHCRYDLISFSVENLYVIQYTRIYNRFLCSWWWIYMNYSVSYRFCYPSITLFILQAYLNFMVNKQNHARLVIVFEMSILEHKRADLSVI